MCCDGGIESSVASVEWGVFLHPPPHASSIRYPCCGTSCPRAVPGCCRANVPNGDLCSSVAIFGSSFFREPASSVPPVFQPVGMPAANKKSKGLAANTKSKGSAATKESKESRSPGVQESKGLAANTKSKGSAATKKSEGSAATKESKGTAANKKSRSPGVQGVQESKVKKLTEMLKKSEGSAAHQKSKVKKLTKMLEEAQGEAGAAGEAMERMRQQNMVSTAQRHWERHVWTIAWGEHQRNPDSDEWGQ
jgi:hypothetical protein